MQEQSKDKISVFDYTDYRKFLTLRDSTGAQGPKNYYVDDSHHLQTMMVDRFSE